MKRMARCVGLQHGHFTNHSARKYLVQKLSDNHVSPNEIIQISGHRNLQSINSYSQISETHHREISTLITCTERSQSTAMFFNPNRPEQTERTTCTRTAVFGTGSSTGISEFNIFCTNLWRHNKHKFLQQR